VQPRTRDLGYALELLISLTEVAAEEGLLNFEDPLYASLSKPSIPSRATYMFCFLLGATMTSGMFVYQFWAWSRDLLNWRALWTLGIEVLIGGGFVILIGLAFRWRWLRKRFALRAYEQMIDSILTKAE
jgi:hypothetical protein